MGSGLRGESQRGGSFFSVVKCPFTGVKFRQTFEWYLLAGSFHYVRNRTLSIRTQQQAALELGSFVRNVLLFQRGLSYVAAELEV